MVGRGTVHEIVTVDLSADLHNRDDSRHSFELGEARRVDHFSRQVGCRRPTDLGFVRMRMECAIRAPSEALAFPFSHPPGRYKRTWH